MTSDYDSLRPPEPGRRKRKGGKGRRRSLFGQGDGAREMSMVPDVEFTSYYGRPVVKAPPWKHEVPAYLFLGGVAGGSGLIALGAQLTGLEVLRRNARLGGLVAIGLGGAALGAQPRQVDEPQRLHPRRAHPVVVGFEVGAQLAGLLAGADDAGEQLDPRRNGFHHIATERRITAEFTGEPDHAPGCGLTSKQIEHGGQDVGQLRRRGGMRRDAVSVSPLASS